MSEFITTLVKLSLHVSIALKYTRFVPDAIRTDVALGGNISTTDTQPIGARKKVSRSAAAARNWR